MKIHALRKEFAGAAASYDKAAVLAREVGRRMDERLSLVRLAPRCVADIGCATGDGVRTLQTRYPEALPLAVDYALPMLAAVRAHSQARDGWLARLRGRTPRLVNADVRALPLATGSIDLVWSNLMLHWLPDPRTAFAELQRVLQVGGLLQFSLLGPDTLKGLRRALCAVDGTTRAAGATSAAGAAITAGTAVPPAPTFIDMHDIGDMLLAAGFADPVMEMELLTLTYATPRAFLADQRRLGVRDALLGRLAGGDSRGWQAWRRIFAAWERCDGRLPAHFEIIYGHAWKAAPRAIADGRAIMQFQPQPQGNHIKP